MGLLAPLYFAGLLAIALPIVFHLIRRTPQGKQVFSSLMFLQPSPPTLTRRSRLSNILLLLLRAAALALLAFAFCRPFFQSRDDAAATQGRGRRVAILIDTSASMKRADLWQQAGQKLQQTVDELRPEDEASLYFFDRQVKPGLTFSEWNELTPGVRAATLKSRFAQAEPTWAPTRLGDALASVADLLVEEEGTKSEQDRSGRQLVLITDLQAGGHVEALQGHQWPPSVLLDVRAVAPKQPTNATLQLAEVETPPTTADRVADTTASAAGAEDTRLRVRVVNQPGSGSEQFTLGWADSRGPVAGMAPLKVYVPAGRSQVVKVPRPSAGTSTTQPSSAPTTVADRLVLQGDDFDFDNTLFVVPPRTDVVRVLYVGDEEAGNLQGLLYYLSGALGESAQRKIELIVRKPLEPLGAADLVDVRLAVVTSPVSADRADLIRKHVEAGGTSLWVVKESADTAAVTTLLGGAASPPSTQPAEGSATLAERSVRDYALIGRVDMTHPLFAPFAEARFADFTKIRFWKHRTLKLPTGHDARVIAWFDDGDPFLVERSLGQGKLLVATAGWHPADSQLALSTKFVPLIAGLVRRKDGSTVETQQLVYEPIALPAVRTGQNRQLVTPAGQSVAIAATATAVAAEAIDRPGIFTLTVDGVPTPVAVNLPADESRTAPVGVEELERWGVKLGKAMTAEQVVERQRQLKTAELESKQKLWRWMILAVLGFIAAESIVAGLLARRSSVAAPA